MRVRKILAILLVIALVGWGIEAIWLVYCNMSAPAQIKKQADRERRAIEVQFRDRERQLHADYEREKYLAIGTTVYDRILNAKQPTIVELIEKIAAESMPKNWNCQVRVEEFAHFILLVYLPRNSVRVGAGTLASYLAPVVEHCDQYLTDVAVFDHAHKSYLYYNNKALKHIKSGLKVSGALLDRVKQQGESFTRFNSTTIQCEKNEGHLILPIQITGPRGVETCLALFDTGASVTTVSHSIISKTGPDNLATAPKRSFNTANGLMSCPIVYREVDIGGFSRRIEVAVNQRDELNLLGMNYFHGMKYIVESENACIHIWEEQSIETPKINHVPRKSALEDLRIPVVGERTETEPQDKKTPSETVTPSGNVHSRDMNDLAIFADKWLDNGHDANDPQEN